MKLKSTNIYYLIGLIPWLVLDLGLALYLSYDIKWLFYPLLLIGIGVIYLLVQKFTYLPRAKSEYESLEESKITLPVSYGVDIYTCKSLSQHSFILRVAEVLSPLILQKNETLKVVMNEQLLKEEGEQFMQIAVVRELERYRTKSQVKVVLRLVVPLLMMVGVVLTVLAFRVNLLDYATSFTVNFALPFMVVVIFLLHLFLWNRYLSKEESRLDRFLLQHFSLGAVEHYISKIEELEGSNEKEKYKVFNQHYAKERISKLHH